MSSSFDGRPQVLLAAFRGLDFTTSAHDKWLWGCLTKQATGTPFLICLVLARILERGFSEDAG
jgi:hypothetical protein